MCFKYGLVWCLTKNGAQIPSHTLRMSFYMPYILKSHNTCGWATVSRLSLDLTMCRLKNNNYAEMIFDHTTGTGRLSPATIRDICIVIYYSRLHAC